MTRWVSEIRGAHWAAVAVQVLVPLERVTRGHGGLSSHSQRYRRAHPESPTVPCQTRQRKRSGSLRYGQLYTLCDDLTRHPASRAIPARTIIEVSPVLLFAKDEYNAHGRHTLLDHYAFNWRDGRMALPLGLGALRLLFPCRLDESASR